MKTPHHGSPGRDWILTHEAGELITAGPTHSQSTTGRNILRRFPCQHSPAVSLSHRPSDHGGAGGCLGTSLQLRALAPVYDSEPKLPGEEPVRAGTSSGLFHSIRGRGGGEGLIRASIYVMRYWSKLVCFDA